MKHGELVDTILEPLEVGVRPQHGREGPLVMDFWGDRPAARHTGFQVDDVDYWFNRVREAGYKTQTDYVWNLSETARSFLFYDDDHHLIQLVQNPNGSGWL